MSETRYNVSLLADSSDVILNLNSSLSEILTSYDYPISDFSLPELKSVLLYNANDNAHATAIKRSSFSLKIYYLQNTKTSVCWYGDQPDDGNFILIRGDETFLEFQTKWQAKLTKIIAEKEKNPPHAASPLTTIKNKPKSDFLLWEDLLNPSHFVLVSIILLLSSFLAPAPLLLCSLITGFLAIPTLFGYLAIKVNKDFQLLSDHLWNPLVESEGFPKKIKQNLHLTDDIPHSCWTDTLHAQKAIEEEEDYVYKNTTSWKLLAYLKALPIRGITWMNKHPYQSLVVGLGIFALGIVTMCMITIPAFPFNPFDFISHQLVEGIQGIIAWAPNTLGFLNNLITPVATNVISGIMFLAGSLSIIDNVRRIGRAIYAAHGNATEKFEGADPDDFAELKIDPLEGLYKNYVVDSYRHTILWRKEQVDSESSSKIPPPQPPEHN